MAVTPDIFQQLGFVKLTPAGSKTTFTLRQNLITHTIKRRPVPRKQPEVEGAPIDDTGSDPDTFDVPLLFARSDTVLQAIIGEAVYPQYHARFLREARVRGTATIYIPARGELRVCVDSIVSTQSPDARDCENVMLRVLVDREDGRAGADTFNLPSAKSAPPILLQQFASAAVQVGLGGDLLGDLEAAVDALQAAINSPLDAAGDVSRRADRVLNLCGKIRRLSTAPVQPFRAGGTPPLLLAEAVEPLTLLALLEDAAAAQRSAVNGTATTRPRRFDRVLSIFEIATLLGQPVDELIRLNARLPLWGVPAGTEIIVKAA